MPPEAHAKLGASSAHRWLNCTASPNFESQFEDKPRGRYAEEGTLAHAFCEIFGRRAFKLCTDTEFKEEVARLQLNELYDPEMLTTASRYIDVLKDAANGYSAEPAVMFEQRVCFDNYVPEGFGTCDCIMVGDKSLRIFDYKHGKGVVVDAENNPQMRLYALGALLKYQVVYGDTIESVTTTIVQPRISSEPSVETLTKQELLEWGESIKPIALQAYTGIDATFNTGPWCRFCRGYVACREKASAYEAMAELRLLKPDPNKLTDDEIGEVLTKCADLSEWVSAVQEYARAQILSGSQIRGYRVVEGRSSRVWTAQDKAFQALKDAGVASDETLYQKSPISLSNVEKLIGTKLFTELVGQYVEKPKGKPTLVPADDKRADYQDTTAEEERRRLLEG